VDAHIDSVTLVVVDVATDDEDNFAADIGDYYHYYVYVYMMLMIMLRKY